MLKKFNNITGIILAGGKSSRMGSDKGLTLFNNKPLINYVIDVLQPLCEKIIISANNSEYDKFGYDVINDIVPDSGPMGGIYSALLHSTTDVNIVLSCDSPFVKTQTFEYLMEQYDNADICVPMQSSGKYEPLCGIYKKSVIPYFKEFIENKNYKIPMVFEIVKFQEVKITENNEFFNFQTFRNLNSKEDIKQAEIKKLN